MVHLNVYPKAAIAEFDELQYDMTRAARCSQVSTSISSHRLSIRRVSRTTSPHRADPQLIMYPAPLRSVVTSRPYRHRY